MTKRRNVSVMTTAGIANGSAIVPRWNLAFSVVLRTYLSNLYIDNGSSMRAVTLYFILNQALAFLLSVSSPECAGYFLCFIVFKFNDVLPLRKDGDLGHCCFFRFWFL
jgi:hypothetical protein